MNNYLLPHLDEEGLKIFSNECVGRKVYLEYGSGGSTVFACNRMKIPTIISIESDKNFVNLINSLCDRDATQGVAILHADIGEVLDWGVPKDKAGISEYWRYMSMPWDVAKINKLDPDLIFIDGRFRVASFLYSILNAKKGTIILFDDYIDRPEYHIAQKFAVLHSIHGRMAKFVVNNQNDLPNLVKHIAKYSIIQD
jgi:hypothetical protein